MVSLMFQCWLFNSLIQNLLCRNLPPPFTCVLSHPSVSVGTCGYSFYFAAYFIPWSFILNQPSLQKKEKCRSKNLQSLSVRYKEGRVSFFFLPVLLLLLWRMSVHRKAPRKTAIILYNKTPDCTLVRQTQPLGIAWSGKGRSDPRTWLKISGLKSEMVINQGSSLTGKAISFLCSDSPSPSPELQSNLLAK